MGKKAPGPCTLCAILFMRIQITAFMSTLAPYGVLYSVDIFRDMFELCILKPVI